MKHYKGMKKNCFYGRAVPFHLKKWLLVMKLCMLLMVVLNLGVLASGHAQQRVSLSMQNVTLEQVIKELKRQTGLRFFYSVEKVRGESKEMVKVKDDILENALREILKGTGLTFTIMNDVVVIKDEILSVADSIIRKQKLIQGRVKDEAGEVLPGVTVLVKGSTVGVVTDRNGQYKIALPDQKNIFLLFSFVGMKTKEVRYVGQDTINVVLVEDIEALDEVVVTGYQVLRKHSMAGATSSVKAEDLFLNGTQTLEQALQGKLPGMMVMNQSGLTGTRQKVRVRGTSTLLGNADPVWVVDGIIQEDPLPFNATELTNIGNEDMINEFVGGAIAWLNPNDIESVTVLKDASATAIYGVKAANGVIVITTKKGERGRMAIGYAGNFSTSSKLSYDKMNLMNSKQRVDFSREIYETGGLFNTQQVGYLNLALKYKLGNITLEEFSAEVKKLETVNTDWFDILFRNPFSHSHNISISGGSDKATYRAAFGFSDANNTARGNGQTKYNGSLNVSSVFWERLTASFSLSGSYAKTKAFVGTDPYAYASATSRAIACHDESGELVFYPLNNGYKYNFLFEKQQSGNENTVASLNSSLSLRFVLTEGLVFQSLFGYNYSSMHGETYYSEQTNYITAIRKYEYQTIDPSTGTMVQSGNLPHGGELTQTENRNMNYTWRNSLEFSRVYGEHGVTLMIGQECRSTKVDGVAQTQYGYLPHWGKSFAVVPPVREESGGVNDYAVTYPRITDQMLNFLSFYATGSYIYDNRYAFNASIRSDASNRFGQDKRTRYQPVWSVGFRWNVSREHWLEGQDYINDVSLRISYGFQGNVAENVGPDLITSIPSSGGIHEKIGKYVLNVKSLPAPDLTWEKTKTINAGLDFSVIHNKVNLSFNYYYKRTVDMIVNKSVPYENGVTKMAINGGNMTNSGWDMAVSLVPVRTKDFVWSLGASFSKNYNKIKSKLEPKEDWKTAVSGNLTKDGYPVTGFWVFRSKGLNPEDGSPVIDLEGTKEEAAIRDATEYMVYAGKFEPDFSTGINMNFRYKSLSLATSFYLSVGAKRLLAPLYDEANFELAVSEYSNLSKDMVKRWRKAGDDTRTDIPAIPNMFRNAEIKPFGEAHDYKFYPYEMYNNSSARVVNASYLRCNNISLSYNVPEKLISGFAQSISLSFSVSNPFQIVSKDYKGVDPEGAMGNQPLSRNYTFGLNVSF